MTFRVHASATRRGACAALLAGTTLAGFASETQASVVISSGTTQHMSCSAGVCTATAANAVLNVTQLKNLLASAALTVKSASIAKDIAVAAAVGWTGANRLTLDAYRSLAIKSPISDSGSGGLTLTTNDGGTGGTLAFAGAGRISFVGTANSLIINGATYTLVANIAKLASDIAANPGGHFALARNYNATPDGTYTTSPILTPLTGRFEGLGNAISNLSLNGTASIALFSQIGAGGAVDALILANVKATGVPFTYVAGLAADNEGTISGSAVTGAVMIAGSNGNTKVGALVGYNNGSIVNSHAGASVNGEGYVGGLVGENNSAAGAIVSCSASGTVTSGNANYAGGLVGYNAGSITTSHASGTVAAGSESAGGGLVGYNVTPGVIIRSYATGAVNGGDTSQVGGLDGLEAGGVSNSFATGAVTGAGNSFDGGLAGKDSGGDIIGDSYATGAVTGGPNANIGGLVGSRVLNSSVLVSDYSTGHVSGTSSTIGGLLGADATPADDIAVTYWDTTTSGVTDLSRGAGNVSNDPGIAGKTTKQLQAGLPKGFAASIWAESAKINGGLPYLIYNPPPK